MQKNRQSTPGTTEILEQLYSMAEMADMLDNDEVWNLLVTISLYKDLRKVQREIQRFYRLVSPVYQSQMTMRSTDPFHLNGHECIEVGRGDILVGHAILQDRLTQVPIRIGHDDFLGMVSIFGATRTGKSALSQMIALQAMQKGYTVWLFDVENEARPLVLHYPELLVIGADRGQDRDNFLEAPPGVSQKKWVPIVVEEFAKQLALREASISLLRDAIYEVFAKMDGRIPSLIQVRDHLQKKYDDGKQKRSFREIDWLASVLNRLSTIIAELGETIDCSKGFDFSLLAERSIVFEMRDMSGYTQNLYRVMKVLKLYHYQMVQ